MTSANEPSVNDEAEAAVATASSSDTADATAESEAVLSESPSEKPAVEMQIHRSEPQAESKLTFGWAVAIAVMIGTAGGVAYNQWRLDQVRAAMAAAQAEPEQVDGSQLMVNGAPKLSRPTPVDDRGFRVRVPESLRVKLVKANVNRILQVREPKGKLLLSINSGPIFPWQSTDELRGMIAGAEWKPSPVELPEHQVTFKFDGEGWNYGRSKSTLVLVGHGRTFQIMVRDWKHPLVKEVLESFRTVPGSDWRNIYRYTFKLDAEAQASEGLKKTIDLKLQWLGDDLATYGTPVVVKGAKNYRAGKFDLIDTRIFNDVLDTTVRRAQRKRKIKNRKVEGDECGAVADRYGKEKKPGAGPTWPEEEDEGEEAKAKPEAQPPAPQPEPKQEPKKAPAPSSGP